ncbi:phosphohistidine phosphatase SixA [Desulforhopalus vacuolatus]|uniref:phosphohistidine phosphatase SixA n=1 Tax=Desulforhopalus vacuolatus TaxID=40414 RepID=UPI00196664F3|nr:phosphohistidine phosphatase SixA [Desulforhopalus vacuolatus]MBM9518203.1 phosphohistidine phosphatase SixA [Desulforhopalus vacuolatus]
MALYFVQHGLSASKDQDPEQGLTEIGMDEVKFIAQAAKGYQVPVGTIFHSQKKRAAQTAELLSAALQSDKDIQQITGIKPLDDVKAFAATLTCAGNSMYVGHLPFMEKLTSYLVAGSTDLTVFKFQNGGIVCLDQGSDGSTWFIKWSLMPHIS